MDPELKTFLEELTRRLDRIGSRMDESFDRLAAQIQDMGESLGRQLRELRDMAEHAVVRLDEIVAGIDFEALERHSAHLRRRD